MKRLYCKFERIGGVLSGAIVSLAAVAVILLGFMVLAPAMGSLIRDSDSAAVHSPV